VGTIVAGGSVGDEVVGDTIVGGLITGASDTSMGVKGLIVCCVEAAIIGDDEVITTSLSVAGGGDGTISSCAEVISIANANDNTIAVVLMSIGSDDIDTIYLLLIAFATKEKSFM